MNCTIFRCTRQTGLYLYLRAGFDPATLPTELVRRTGTLTEVMQLDLQPQRRLARADARTVLERLDSCGWYLQLPPDGQVQAHLYFGD